jgi:N-acetylglucosaminyl-diphospho-decaprenol L-rhamnosyltransferase
MVREADGRNPTVAGVVVYHDWDPDLPACLAALAPEVDELVVVANLADARRPELPVEGRLVVNERALGFAANVNKGVAATSAPYVVTANPDAIAGAGAVRRLLAFAREHPRAGIVGPQLLYPDGEWQPSRRRFPTVLGTVIRRTPLRLVLRKERWQRSHYLLDERPEAPAQADWMLGGFLLLRRQMLDELGGLDEGFRLYGEDIDLGYRAARAGWERWYVPDAIVQHNYHAVIDRRFLTRRTWWHFRGMVRFVRKHPERLAAVW